MTTVQTLRGPIDSSGLGRVLVHEHIFTLAAVVLLFEACGELVVESEDSLGNKARVRRMVSLDDSGWFAGRWRAIAADAGGDEHGDDSEADAHGPCSLQPTCHRRSE